MSESNWIVRAACRGEDVELFYSNDPLRVRQAVRICSGCPVRRECFEDALDRGEPFGIWGGLKESRRRRLTRQLGAA